MKSYALIVALCVIAGCSRSDSNPPVDSTRVRDSIATRRYIDSVRNARADSSVAPIDSPKPKKAHKPKKGK